MFSLAKKTTLVVEDFAEFARSVRGMLHSMGATNVDIVYNAEDAISACKARKYDIILSDYNLGSKKDGQQLLEELIKHDQVKSNTVFLMLTAENTTAMVMGAVEYQPDGYIAKPFNGNLLKSRLQKATDKKDSLLPIKKAMAKKDWQQALVEIDNLLPKFPKYKMSCLRLKYKVLKELNRLDEALRLTMEIINNRSIPWAMEAVGEIHFKKREFEKAQDIFKNMIKEFPMALEGYDWLAKTQELLGNKIDAQETLVNAIKKSPKALGRQKNLGRLADENNDVEQMVISYRNAVKYAENSAFATPDEYIALTKAIGKQFAKDKFNEKLLEEAELTFKKVESNFAHSNVNKLRTNVAQASLYGKCDRLEQSNLHVKNAEKHLDALDEQLSATISLELSATLIELDKTDIAEKILNEAIQQNLDDPEFIEKATKLSQNQELIKQSQQTSQYNNKAIAFFRKKQYESSAEWFDKAHNLSPNNINIRLNYVQTLLKQIQSDSNKNDHIRKADSLIANMPQLAYSDQRYPRYSELSRLTQLMLQKL